jgi:hypothetical protein
MGDGGKGSKPRPFSVSQAEYDSRWDAIFQRDLKEEKIEMPGTVGGAKVVFRNENEGSDSNSDNRK